MKEPSNLNELERLEGELNVWIRRFPSTAWLLAVSAAARQPEHRTFVLADVATRAIRESNPERSGQLSWSEFRRFCDASQRLLLADPMGWPENEARLHASNAGPVLFRLLESQFRFDRVPTAGFGRPLLLYGEEVRRTASKRSSFDVRAAIQQSLGMPLESFVRFGSALNAFDRANQHTTNAPVFSLPHGEQLLARLGISQSEQLAAFNHVSADRDRIRGFSEGKARNRSFAAYDLNPLYRFPALLPFKRDKDLRAIAPIPDLLMSRFSTGIFFDLLRSRGTIFTDWFGYAFEAYVKTLLDHCGRLEILGEADLARFVPDGVRLIDFIVEGRSPVLIECKAGGGALAALQGDPEAEAKVVEKLVEGVLQLDDWKRLVKANQRTWFPRSGTGEPLTILFTYHVSESVDTAIGRKWLSSVCGGRSLPDLILDVGWLEEFQPCFAAGLPIETAARAHVQDGLPALQALAKATGKGVEDSLLYAEGMKLVPRQ